MTVSIAICGSMSFMEEMEAIAGAFAALGHRPTTPRREEQNFDWSDLKSTDVAARKRYFIDHHLNIIRKSDVVLIANLQKRGIKGYVGPNTLMEVAFAHALGLPVIFMNDPSEQENGLECIAVSSGCLSGDAMGFNGLYSELLLRIPTKDGNNAQRCDQN